MMRKVWVIDCDYGMRFALHAYEHAFDTREEAEAFADKANAELKRIEAEDDVARQELDRNRDDRVGRAIKAVLGA